MSAHPLHLPLPHFDAAYLKSTLHAAARTLWALFEEAGRQRAAHELRQLEQRWAVTSPHLAQVVRQRRAV